MEAKPTYAELEDKITALSEKVRDQLSLENQSWIPLMIPSIWWTSMAATSL